MKPLNYRFLTNWRVRGTVEEVFDILSEICGFVLWWPTDYLEVNKIRAGAKNGLRRVVKLRTKGRLP
ncbi:MAG: hypothetical protein OEM82_05145 [Acidobacteriota bacterium]|nr:hypothetical protein [Acidobacteriota bacterium]